MSYRIREDSATTRPLPALPGIPPATRPPVSPAPRLAPPTGADVLAAVVGVGVVLLIGIGVTVGFTLLVLVPLLRGLP